MKTVNLNTMSSFLRWMERDDVTEEMLRAFRDRPDEAAEAIGAIAAKSPRSRLPLPKPASDPMVQRSVAPTRPAPPLEEATHPFEEDPDGSRPTVSPPPIESSRERTSSPEIETHMSSPPPGVDDWEGQTTILSEDDIRRQLGSVPPEGVEDLPIEELEEDDGGDRPPEDRM